MRRLVRLLRVKMIVTRKRDGAGIMCRYECMNDADGLHEGIYHIKLAGQEPLCLLSACEALFDQQFILDLSYPRTAHVILIRTGKSTPAV